MPRMLARLFAVYCTARLAGALQVASDSEKGCDCLSWPAAFAPKHAADCAGMHEPYVCDRFLMKLPNESFCLNSWFGAATKQWCYVSKACQRGENLTWAQDGVQPNVLFRTCEAKDKRLGDKKIMDLHAWCKDNNLDVGVAAQWAYPTWQREKLSEVMSFWGLEAPAGAPNATAVNATLKAGLQELEASGKTTFFNSQTERSPFGVVEGQQLYWMNLGQPFIQLVLSGKEHSMQPGEVNDVKCVAGCEHNEKPWWHELNKIGAGDA